MIRAFTNDPELLSIARDPRYLRIFSHSQLSASSRALPWRGQHLTCRPWRTLSAAENEAPWREATHQQLFGATTKTGRSLWVPERDVSETTKLFSRITEDMKNGAGNPHPHILTSWRA